MGARAENGVLDPPSPFPGHDEEPACGKKTFASAFNSAVLRGKTITSAAVSEGKVVTSAAVSKGKVVTSAAVSKGKVVTSAAVSKGKTVTTAAVSKGKTVTSAVSSAVGKKGRFWRTFQKSKGDGAEGLDGGQGPDEDFIQFSEEDLGPAAAGDTAAGDSAGEELVAAVMEMFPHLGEEAVASALLIRGEPVDSLIERAMQRDDQDLLRDEGAKGGDEDLLGLAFQDVGQEAEDVDSAGLLECFTEPLLETTPAEEATKPALDDRLAGPPQDHVREGAENAAQARENRAARAARAARLAAEAEAAEKTVAEAIQVRPHASSNTSPPSSYIV